MDPQLEPTLEAIVRILRTCRSVLFVTGAGISADSGLPTYRGVGGLYQGQATEEGISIEEALSGWMFSRQPDITWKYLWQIGASCHGAQPNRAHEVIALLEERKRKVIVLTQNIDGLHRVAGTTNLIELHGHAFDLYCTQCRKEFTAAELIADYELEPELPPKCPDCDGLIRPDVVLFGEHLPAQAVQGLNEVSHRPLDLVISIGTSSAFPYILQPILEASYRGAPTVEINPAETQVSDIVTYRLKLGAAEAMDRIWNYL